MSERLIDFSSFVVNVPGVDPEDFGSRTEKVVYHASAVFASDLA